MKMQQKLDEGDYVIDNCKEKAFLDKLHKKLLDQLCAMDIDMDVFKEKKKTWFQHQFLDICTN